MNLIFKRRKEVTKKKLDKIIRLRKRKLNLIGEFRAIREKYNLKIHNIDSKLFDLIIKKR